MTETAIPVSVRERGVGVVETSSFWGGLTTESTPELRWPQNIRVYSRMGDQDAQVSSVLQAVRAPILRTRWYVDGRGCDPEVTEFIGANLGLEVTNVAGQTGVEHPARLRGRDRFSWGLHLDDALEYLVYGHAVFEQVYRYDDQGKARLRKLGFRPPSTIAKFDVAQDGGLNGIQQRSIGMLTNAVALGTSGLVTLPINRLVVYSHGRHGGNWQGKSLLRPAYKNWLLKDDALRTAAISLARNGVGLPVYRSASDDPAEIAKGEDIARRARAGDNSGVAVPKDADFELKGVTGKVVDADAFIRYQDEQIARAVLAHFLNLGTQTGSWALGSTFADFFTLSLQSVAEELRETATRHVIEDLVDINFGPSVPAPQLAFDEIGSRTPVSTELAALRKELGLEDDKDLADFMSNSVAA